MTEENLGILKQYVNRIDNYLLRYTQDKNMIQKSVVLAMEHSLTAGGKRIRPVLALEFYRLCGGKDDILDIACSIEMMHTFSLIHDDLPCMDNDDYRRGKASCHKLYGEAVALLAGDALAIAPFEIIADYSLNNKISSECAVKVIKELSSAVGVGGMIGGQIIDIENEGKQIDKQTLILLDSLKTGALIKASCKIGCILAGADDKTTQLAEMYAEKIGLAFQIVDDILDKTSSFEQLGKPINSDEEQNKTTYVSVYGLQESKAMAKKLTDEAIEILNNFEENEFLIDLTNMLFERNN